MKITFYPRRDDEEPLCFHLGGTGREVLENNACIIMSELPTAVIQLRIYLLFTVKLRNNLPSLLSSRNMAKLCSEGWGVEPHFPPGVGLRIFNGKLLGYPPKSPML